MRGRLAFVAVLGPITHGRGTQRRLDHVTDDQARMVHVLFDLMMALQSHSRSQRVQLAKLVPALLLLLEADLSIIY